MAFEGGPGKATAMTVVVHGPQDPGYFDFFLSALHLFRSLLVGPSKRAMDGSL